ncbi:MAG: asparagine synthase (glutamine-hydrolyzing) [Bacteroidia bacterium]|nr:asparagine synthase (glutamine-hydrolyzing) [Bacteroidia bacterium]
MCGFTAVFSQVPISPDGLTGLEQVLKHRGPDDHGQYRSSDDRVALFHNRLSFFDLSEKGKQPLQSADGRYVLVYNGEIYNFREIRTELQAQGLAFTTDTDTEVILNGYAHWGKAILQKLEGMFAFVLFDSHTKQLLAARDRFGIKPLFYYQSNDFLVFSSEVKGILALPALASSIRVRKTSIALFLANRYVPAPYTIWEQVFKLQPAFYLESDFSFKPRLDEYWKPTLSNHRLARKEVVEHTRFLLSQSVEKHLRSDVPVGGFLSGGFDSSALAVLARDVVGNSFQTFSIGFENWTDSEDKYAELVANHLGLPMSRHISKQIDLHKVRQLMFHYDDPIADISILPTFEVSRIAVEKVKAVVSGEGADELFGGYWWNKGNPFYYESPWKRISAMLGGKSFGMVKSHYIHAMSMGLFDLNELSQALTPDYRHSLPDDPFAHFDRFQLSDDQPLVKQLQYLDIKTFMTELVLNKVDRASMANSLEVRVPFLDHHLVEFMLGLHPDSFMEEGVQKPILKTLLNNRVPDSILERKKQGFVGPDAFYMNYDLYAEQLRNGLLVKSEVIQPRYIEQKLQQKDHWRLWKIYVLENWWINWMQP